MAKEEISINELAEKIYASVGGMDNVQSIVHCMTRVRTVSYTHLTLPTIA